MPTNTLFRKPVHGRRAGHNRYRGKLLCGLLAVSLLATVPHTSAFATPEAGSTGERWTTRLRNKMFGTRTRKLVSNSGILAFVAGAMMGHGKMTERHLTAADLHRANTKVVTVHDANGNIITPRAFIERIGPAAAEAFVGGGKTPHDVARAWAAARPATGSLSERISGTINERATAQGAYVREGVPHTAGLWTNDGAQKVKVTPYRPSTKGRGSVEEGDPIVPTKAPTAASPVDPANVAKITKLESALGGLGTAARFSGGAPLQHLLTATANYNKHSQRAMQGEWSIAVPKTEKTPGIPASASVKALRTAISWVAQDPNAPVVDGNGITMTRIGLLLKALPTVTQNGVAGSASRTFASRQPEITALHGIFAPKESAGTTAASGGGGPKGTPGETVSAIRAMEGDPVYLGSKNPLYNLFFGSGGK